MEHQQRRRYNFWPIALPTLAIIGLCTMIYYNEKPADQLPDQAKQSRATPQKLAPLTCVAPIGELWASGHNDGSIHLWHPDGSSADTAEIRLDKKAITGLSASLNGKLLYATDGQQLTALSIGTGEYTGKEVIDVQKATRIDAITSVKGGVAVAYHPSNSNKEDVIIVLEEKDADGANRQLSLPGMDSLARPTRIGALAYAAKPELLLAAGNSGFLIGWQKQTRLLTYDLYAQGGEIWDVAVTEDGLIAASVSDTHLLNIWDLDDDKHQSIPLKGSPTHVALSPGGALIAVSYKDKPTQVFDTQYGTEHPGLKQSGKPAIDVAFTADGQYLIEGLKEGPTFHDLSQVAPVIPDLH